MQITEEETNKYGIRIEDINSWYSVLKWHELPNLQTCHRHEDMEEFESEYFKTEEINNLIKIIFDFIKSGGSSNAQFMGKMGSGKTTFLHYLRRILISNPDISEKIFFSIIRTGRIPLKEHEQGLKEYFVTVTFKKLFIHCGYREIYDRIVEQDINYELKLARLQTFYLDSDNYFKKQLIVVLDDLDTIHNHTDVINITNSFKRICGSGDGINKWVSIRETTFENYPESVQKEFTFFQQPFTLPSVSLYKIINKRIKAKNGSNAINPFSEDLCNIIMKLKHGSVRDSLSLLATIHHHTKAPKKNQGESFIQNWFKNSAISALVKLHKIPNIHTQEYIVLHNYPIAYDMLNVIRYSHIKVHIFNIIYNIARSHRGTLFNGAYSLIENQLNMVFKILIKNEIIFIDSETEKITLSEKAKILISFQQKTYNEICKNLAIQEKLDIDNEYWEILFKHTNYKVYSQNINISRG